MTENSRIQNVHSPYLTLEEQGSEPSTPDAGTQRAFIDSADGLLKLIDESDIVKHVSGGIIDHDLQRYTGGNITLNSASWADVPGPADLVIDAFDGDLIVVTLSGLWGAETVEAYLDFATRVSGSPVNYVSGGAAGASNRGVVGWQAILGPSGGGMNGASIGSIDYIVQSGDISSGTVTLRLRYRTSSASNKTLFATSDIPFHLQVKNLGQA